ncbi:MAG: hypothetical protein WCL51_17320 [Bacteroidota bacterium]
MRVNVNKSEQRVYISRYTNIEGLTYSARKISFSYCNNTMPYNYKWVCNLTK